MNRLAIITFFLTGIFHTTIAQEASGSFTYGEFKAGYGVTIFGEGLASRVEEGNFSQSGGGMASLAVYRKFEKISYLNFGLKFKGLGGSPSTNEAGDEMFFNFWASGISVKYYPLRKSADGGLFVQGDIYYVSQFTQKYRNTEALTFDHQFAIGNSFGGILGYDYAIPNSDYGFTMGLEYEFASRQGEVTGLGDQQFLNSNLGGMIGLRF